MNKQYFKTIDSETKAYLLGFILADGWVTSNKRVLGLAVNSIDVEIIHLLKNELGSKHKVRELTKNRKNPLSRVEISCTELVKDLNTLGITSNKSKDSSLPNVPAEYMVHVLRGLMDGDGSFSGIAQPCLVSGSIDLMNSINKWYKNHYGKEFNILTTVRDKVSYYKIQFGKDHHDLILDMYDNANVYLERKYSQFLEHKAYRERIALKAHKKCNSKVDNEE